MDHDREIFCKTPGNVLKSASAPTLFVSVWDGWICYRSIGKEGGVPILLLQRYQGCIDDWDPDLLDRLSLRRPVVIFDYPGIGRSTGTPLSDFNAFAEFSVDFARSIGIDRADVLGWSFSSFTAAYIALTAPNFVRRLLLAAASPGYLAAAPRPIITSGLVGTTSGLHDADYAYLFFAHTQEGRRAATEHLARLRSRPDFYREMLDRDALACQLVARALLLTPEGSLQPRLAEIGVPTLITHGMQDIRIPVLHGLTMAQMIPDARFIAYPKSAHGFLFEFSEKFAEDVEAFLG